MFLHISHKSSLPGKKKRLVIRRGTLCTPLDRDCGIIGSLIDFCTQMKETKFNEVPMFAVDLCFAPPMLLAGGGGTANLLKFWLKKEILLFLFYTL